MQDRPNTLGGPLPSTTKLQQGAGVNAWGFPRQEISSSSPAKDLRTGAMSSTGLGDYGVVGVNSDGQKRPHTAHGGRAVTQPASTASDLRKTQSTAGAVPSGNLDLQDEVLCAVFSIYLTYSLSVDPSIRTVMLMLWLELEL